MSDKSSKIPRIVIRISRNGNKEDIYGRLITTPDGQTWAMPETYAHDRIPTLSTAYLLDPAQLVQLKDSEDGTPLYLYPSEVPVRPGGDLLPH